LSTHRQHLSWILATSQRPGTPRQHSPSPRRPRSSSPQRRPPSPQRRPPSPEVGGSFAGDEEVERLHRELEEARSLHAEHERQLRHLQEEQESLPSRGSSRGEVDLFVLKMQKIGQRSKIAKSVSSRNSSVSGQSPNRSPAETPRSHYSDTAPLPAGLATVEGALEAGKRPPTVTQSSGGWSWVRKELGQYPSPTRRHPSPEQLREDYIGSDPHWWDEGV